MWKLKFFVNCDGWKVDSEYRKHGYSNTHYFKSKKEAQDWVAEQNTRLPNNKVEIISLVKVTPEEFARDIIL